MVSKRRIDSLSADETEIWKQIEIFLTEHRTPNKSIYLSSIYLSRANQKNSFFFVQTWKLRILLLEKIRIVDSSTRAISRPLHGQPLWIET